MLVEVPRGRQKEGDLSKRWFRDTTMDLFVWSKQSGEICGFQLAYDTHMRERALVWNEDAGFKHLEVHDGATPGHHPQSPIMTSDDNLNIDYLYNRFRKESGDLESEIRYFVAEKIKAFSVPRGHENAALAWGSTAAVQKSIPVWDVPMLLLGLMVVGIVVVVALSQSGA